MVRLILLALMCLSGVAGAMEPVEVSDTRFARATLTVMGPDGAVEYPPSQLEELGTYELTTVTPWRADAAEFIGVRLVDLLAANGLEDAQATRVIAENDYAVTIHRESWINHQALIATRVNGRAHSRRERGPLQFVFDMSDEPETGEKTFEANWVWMAARIERLE